MTYKVFLKDLGNKLKMQRKKLGLTQSELVEKINKGLNKNDDDYLSDKQMSRVECGENATRLDKFVKWALALEKTPDYFLLGIDYGDARTGISITDALNITAQGLETINNKGSDKVILKRLDELFSIYEVDTIVIGRPINMNGTESERTEITDKFIHKLKCKYNTLKIETIDERLTTVAAHKTMNLLDVNKYKKKNIVDTISAVYILETYLNKIKVN